MSNFVVYNKTNQAAIAKFEDHGKAQAFADEANGYHNTDNFEVRSGDEAAKLAADLKDHTVNLASGLGSRPGLFNPDAVVDETGKDKYQLANEKIAIQQNKQDGGVADHSPLVGTAVDAVFEGDKVTPAEQAAGKTKPTSKKSKAQDESDNEQSVDGTNSEPVIK